MTARLFLFPLLAAGFVSQSGATQADGFAAGADVSFLRQAEAQGAVFKDGGVARPGLEILRSHGYTWVRLRLFHTPTRLPNDLAYTIALAKDAKGLGFKVLLDLHYSDTWADPAKQFTPTAWAGKSHEELVAAVFAYSRDTIAAMNEAGVMPDMVQPGNEIIGGMLWPDGKLPQNSSHFIELLRAGIAGIAAGSPAQARPKIMIHIDRGGDVAGTRHFFDRILAAKVPFDVIGQSYYPWWHGTIAKLEENLKFMAETYDKDIVVVEAAYNWRTAEYKDKLAPWPETPDGQRAFLEAVARAVRNTPRGRGIGVFWWEPMVKGGPLRSRGLFDDDGNALPALSVYDLPPVAVDASLRPAAVEELGFPTGGKSPDGRVLGINSRYLTLDGKPWIPVMGEFHYTRYPERDWEEEILKMKAAGVTVVASYVFWIHHEEIEGRFDWSGQRNLRRFVELCAKHGMFVWMRVGPWAHGEARNGGIPDWALKAGPTRQNDPAYLARVRRLFDEIGEQLKGLMWKDGGPVIGVQIENEYSARGAGKGADHILTLQQVARDAGLDAPFYTITGWDNAAVPAMGVIPIFGGYPEGFWFRSATDLPPSVNYFFTTIRCQENVGEDLRPIRPAIDEQFAKFPFFTAEMGGGMESSYHRRAVLAADDVASMLVTKLGSGVNLYGYYVFHGGTNPRGERTTLQESLESGGLNDLPVASYDYQAPLGEFGQVRDSYRATKLFHLFLKDFGSYLAPMPAYFPGVRPTGQLDASTLRATARMRDGRGFLFVNNYQRQHPLPLHPGVRFSLKSGSSTVVFPRRAVDIPAGAYFIWPVNLDVAGATLSWATAQLLCKLDQTDTYFLFAWPGIDPELAFDAATIAEIHAPGAVVTRADGRVYINGLTPSTSVAVTVRSKDGRTARIVVLTREQAKQCWKATVDGRERLFLSPADLYFDADRIRVRSRDNTRMNFSVFPAFDAPPAAERGDDGLFRRYELAVPAKKVAVQWEQVRVAGPAAPVRIKEQVAMAPDETAFERAGVWKVKLPPSALAGGEVYLRLDYVGDVGRVYAGDRLLTDNLYRGEPWEIGLKRWGTTELEVRVLPLRQDAPIYIQQDLRPRLSGSEMAVIRSVTAEVEYDVEVRCGKQVAQRTAAR